MMLKKTNVTDNKKVALVVKNLIHKNPGKKHRELVELCKQRIDVDESVNLVLRSLGENGNIIVRCNRYYAIGSSNKAMVKRRKQRHIDAKNAIGSSNKAVAKRRHKQRPIDTKAEIYLC
ncbi:hypothetical protein FACS1894111_11720 [Clostridia bacterium]|nr:hypothetical protein FACS1894111_11720 [Clostridia bacterium]